MKNLISHEVQRHAWKRAMEVLRCYDLDPEEVIREATEVVEEARRRGDREVSDAEIDAVVRDITAEWNNDL